MDTKSENSSWQHSTTLLSIYSYSCPYVNSFNGQIFIKHSSKSEMHFALKNFWNRILLFSVKPQQESATGIHISLPFEPPSHLPPHPTPLGWHRAPVWVSWAIQQIPTGSLFYIWWCKYPCYSFHTSHPLLPSPRVRKSILYVCFSIAAL